MLVRGEANVVSTCVHCQLGSLMQGQSICYDFDASVVQTLNCGDVQVGQECVRCYPGPGLSAYPSRCPFQCPPHGSVRPLIEHTLRDGRKASPKCDGIGRCGLPREEGDEDGEATRCGRDARGT